MSCQSVQVSEQDTFHLGIQKELGKDPSLKQLSKMTELSAFSAQSGILPLIEANY